MAGASLGLFAVVPLGVVAFLVVPAEGVGVDLDPEVDFIRG